VEVTPNFPQERQFVLESLGEVCGYEEAARAQRMSPEQRLRFHQEHSRPVMEKLHVWLDAQFDEKSVEPNSGLGQAISYLLKHWDRLTLFRRQPGAPLDNSVCERASKKSILHR
jgi:transposase